MAYRKSSDILKSLEDKKNTNFKRRENQKRKVMEKQARKALEEGNILVLVEDVEVPLGAVSVLSKGLGFIPTPKPNDMESRLDMRLTINRILQASSRINYRNTLYNGSSTPSSTASSPSPALFPQKLSQKHYSLSMSSLDEPVNDIVNSMQEELDQRICSQPKGKQKPCKTNLCPAEKKGLKWLQQKIDDEKLSVVEADKGGSILIVDPAMLKKKTLEKLENPALYMKLGKDPLPDLHKHLFDLWVKGKNLSLVTPEEAKFVMGVSNNAKSETSPTNRPSTAPHFKPGKSYFYPSLKVHKLKKEELVPGVEPPIRLITALQDGISKRSDVFVAAKFLKDLEKDFCKDLLTDTTDALLWLDELDKTLPTSAKKRLKAFTFDFKALYDSLSTDLVVEALQAAINTCRPDWTPELKLWIETLVRHSLRSSIGVYENNWYEQVKGVPTGGSLCVQLANMTVFYVLDRYVYSSERLMKDSPSIKRYIDDGAGFYNGTCRQFESWIAQVNDLIAPFGLHIDESTIENPGLYVPFLDIQFMFDNQGNLQTDLFTKETASRSYLHFSSSHPNHVFSGIVYSQFLRLRRIINNKERLNTRLEELKDAFHSCGYPKRMLDNISAKVLNSERKLERKTTPTAQFPPDPLPVRVVSTFGSDENMVNVVKKFEQHLQRTRSFSESDCPSTSQGQLSPTTSNPKKIFQFVKKTGMSLRSRLVTTKALALGSKHGRTVPCNQPRCKCCVQIMDTDSTKVNNKLVKSAPGNCKTYNIIYLVVCQICSKAYIGRTVSPLHVRLNGHRSKFYEIIHNRAKYDDITSDEYSLGLHLVDHGLCENSDFNNNYRCFIVENCSPKQLDVREHRYIHLLKTLRPHGLNTVNPFGLRLMI